MTTTAADLQPGDRILETYEQFALNMRTLEIAEEHALQTIVEERVILSAERRGAEMRIRHARPGSTKGRLAWWPADRPVEVVR